MFILATKSDVWNIWEPWAVGKWKNILIYAKPWQEALQSVGSEFKEKIRFLQLLRCQSDVAPSSGSNLQFNYYRRDWALMSHNLYENVCLPLVNYWHLYWVTYAFSMINTPYPSWPLQPSVLNKSVNLGKNKADTIYQALKMSSAPCSAWLAWKLWRSCDVIKAPSVQSVVFGGECPILFF